MLWALLILSQQVEDRGSQHANRECRDERQQSVGSRRFPRDIQECEAEGCAKRPDMTRDVYGRPAVLAEDECRKRDHQFREADDCEALSHPSATTKTWRVRNCEYARSKVGNVVGGMYTK